MKYYFNCSTYCTGQIYPQIINCSVVTTRDFSKFNKNKMEICFDHFLSCWHIRLSHRNTPQSQASVIANCPKMADALKPVGVLASRQSRVIQNRVIQLNLDCVGTLHSIRTLIGINVSAITRLGYHAEYCTGGTNVWKRLTFVTVPDKNSQKVQCCTVFQKHRLLYVCTVPDKNDGKKYRIWRST